MAWDAIIPCNSVYSCVLTSSSQRGLAITLKSLKLMENHLQEVVGFLS